MSKRIDRPKFDTPPQPIAPAAAVDNSSREEAVVSTSPRHKRPFSGHSLAGLLAPAPGPSFSMAEPDTSSTSIEPAAKRSRTNTPWTATEELRLKAMREDGNSWADIAKTFPSRTEGSVKKHWYKDMHYAEFAEDESQALLNAIKEYDNNKWKVIGQRVGKPAKACEQYAKEHFGNKA